jgi:hypothetical protein
MNISPIIEKHLQAIVRNGKKNMDEYDRYIEHKKKHYRKSNIIPTIKFYIRRKG